jgi:hypothetical protein
MVVEAVVPARELASFSRLYFGKKVILAVIEVGWPAAPNEKFAVLPGLFGSKQEN